MAPKCLHHFGRHTSCAPSFKLVCWKPCLVTGGREGSCSSLIEEPEVLRLDHPSVDTATLYSTKTKKFCVDDGRNFVCNSDTPQSFIYQSFGNNARIGLKGKRGWCLDKGTNIDCSTATRSFRCLPRGR